MHKRITGYEAIEHAQRTGCALNKYSDPTEGPREGITAAEAAAVARQDPGLVYVDVVDTASAAQLARDLYSDDLSREPEIPVQQDGHKAYDAWLASSSDAGDQDTRDALLAVDRDAFAAAWERLAK